MSDLIGKTISHYRIVSKIGEGGMGIVYAADDLLLARLVALKFLRPDAADDAAKRARLMSEARAAAALDHPNICTVYEIGEADGLIFIAFAHVPGKSLRDTLLGEPLPVDEIIDIAAQLAQGLGEAHRRGVIHRDIKPGNIMITPQGVVKITDFGLARLASAPRLTRSGTALGTVAYMAPEQACGEEVDGRSDIWSFGVVLFEMLTGRLPFEKETEAATLHAICSDPAPSVRSIRADIPASLAGAVDRCLEKNPERRYASAEDLLAALRRLQSGMQTGQLLPARRGVWDMATTPVSTVRSLRLARVLRHRTAIFSVAAGAVAIVMLILLLSPTARLIAGIGHNTDSDRIHLAVLPFTNVDGNPQNQPLCDGIVEILTSSLTSLQQRDVFWVVPSSEVRRNNVTTSAAARKIFGVSRTVTGSVLCQNGRLLLTINLVDAHDLRQLTSTVFETPIAEVTQLQGSVVGELVKLLALETDAKSMKDLTKANTNVPGAYEQYLRGRGILSRYEQPENIDAAIACFKQALAKDPEYALAHAAIGEAYWRKYQAENDPQWLTAATGHCQHALEINDQLAPAYITLGIIHLGTGKPDEAALDLQRALELEPLNADAYRELAGAYEAQGLMEKTVETYRRAIELRPNDWAAYNNLGRFYFRHGQYELAAEQFRQVIALTPDNAQGYSSLGGTFILLERWDEAREMFRRSISIKPTYAAYANLGTLDFQQEDYTGAVEALEKAISLEAHPDIRIWWNLASSLDRLGKQDEALATYRRAAQAADAQLAVNPRDPLLLCLLAGCYQMMEDTSQVRPLLERALAIAPQNVEVLFQAGHSYEMIGDRERALELIGRAIQLGYPEQKIERAHDLEKLRADPRYQALKQTSAPQ